MRAVGDFKYVGFFKKVDQYQVRKTGQKLLFTVMSADLYNNPY